MTDTPRRLFFALWPDELTRARLARPGRSVSVALKPSARRVPDANLHITLAFLGNVDAEKMSCIEAAASGVHARPFGLRIDHWGLFPKPRILYLAPRDVPAGLRELVSKLWTALGPCGFSADDRPFRPHVTVARNVSRTVELPAPDGVWWQALDFALVQSVSGRRGPAYTVLDRWPLVEESA